MSVFKFEARRLLIPSIVWTVVLCAIFWCFSLLFPTFQSASDQFTQLLNSFPEQMREALNMDVASMFTLNGFFAFYSMYVMLASAIMACYFGVSIFAREKIAKTSDFLLAKPESRMNMYLQKLAAGWLALVGINIVFVGFLLLMYHVLDHTGASYTVYVLLALNLVIIQFMMFSIGAAIGTLAPKVRVPSGIASGVGFGLFITGMLYGIIKDDVVRFVAPFQYLSSDFIMAHSRYDWPWLGLCVAVIVVPLAVSMIWYVRKDVEST
ncbi:MAG: ABC transporter permease [Coriobacteriia bacterium]|nr:ABC transporter permease [Coriobacteriia bacterium]